MEREQGGSIHRIELQNFKSYKQAQTIGPFKRFTAIIGPNGSGKSNLMDAISFVMGIRSAQLRGNVLGDLVYNNDTEEGNDEKRKAYVRLVFLPDDGVEVHFQRTITAGGNTAYHLDGKPCTWDQYNNKLMSYGVIVKARNFLVFQGDVESIAAKSPKDLTQFIEQIAGSDDLKVEYERLEEEKHRAEEECSANFAKRKALLQEKKITKMQKDEADRHLRLHEELRTTKNESHLFQLYHLDRELEGGKEIITKMTAEMAQLVGAQGLAEKDIAGVKKEQQAAVKESIVAERKVEKQRILLDEQNPLLVKNKEEIKRGTKRLTTAENNLTTRRSADATKLAEIAKLEQDLLDIKEAEKAFAQEIAERAKQEGKLDMEDAQLAEYNRRKEEAGSKTYRLKQEQEVLDMEQLRERDEKTTLEQRVGELEARIQRLDAQAGQNKQKQEDLEKGLKEDKDSLVSMKKKFSEVNEKGRKSRIQQDQIRTKLDEVEGKLREAKADQKESERDKRLADTVESLKRHFPGVRGRLVDLIKVTQRKHNLAVTVALGRNMDAIVVDDDKTGKDCIQYLKEQRLQIMTFIPMSTIRVKPLDERLRQLGGSAKLVLDVIQFDESIERALLYALGPTLVCDTHKEAKKLCFTGGERHKMVSLDGTLISKSGIMTGGMTGNMEAKAAAFDRQALESLKTTRQKFVDEMAELGSSRDRQVEAEQTKQVITELETRLKLTTTEITNCKEKATKLNDERKTMVAARERAIPDVAIFQSKLQERDIQIQKLAKRINEIMDRIFEEFSRAVGVSSIREYEETQLRQAQELAEQRMQFSTQSDKLKSQLEYERSRDTMRPMAEAEKAIEKVKAALELIANEEKRVTAAIKELTEGLETLMVETRSKRARSEELDVKVRELKDMSQAKTAQLGKVKRQLALKEAALEQVAERRLDIVRSCELSDISLAEPSGGRGGGDSADADMDILEDTMDMDADMRGGKAMSGGLDEIKLDYSKLSRALQKSMPDHERNKILDDFKLKIDDMTLDLEKLAPNLKAVEQYEAIKEKEKSFLEELEAAKDHARKATDVFLAKKLERTEMFMDAFNHISSHIDPIYKELTVKPGHMLGGTAFLTLENQDDPFLYGIQFTAMPPTKRFRDMEQLSGGEKTVAALALLFAIHSFRPSPFFVLDEVDAALDNTNVEKVAHYIMTKSHQASGKGGSGFQSVVISLKDLFYDKADALIGVCRDPVDNSSITYSFDLEKFKY